ncbi:hypothetical protein ACIQ7Q_07805 [Streptomyces sp. NPDC096176]|uniref:hypothetical protein n=1 Tax=Streptomyces sp. NPDC096176 TaxID=3366079 RepID=UPI0037F5C843
MRLTREVRQQLLDQNEGFEKRTSSSGKNFTEYRHYRITGGQLLIRASGKTSWADSRFDTGYVGATDDQTRRFLREYLAELNTDGL